MKRDIKVEVEGEMTSDHYKRVVELLVDDEFIRNVVKSNVDKVGAERDNKNVNSHQSGGKSQRER